MIYPSKILNQFDHDHAQMIWIQVVCLRFIWILLECTFTNSARFQRKQIFHGQLSIDLVLPFLTSYGLMRCSEALFSWCYFNWVCCRVLFRTWSQKKCKTPIFGIGLFIMVHVPRCKTYTITLHRQLMIKQALSEKLCITPNKQTNKQT